MLRRRNFFALTIALAIIDLRVEARPKKDVIRFRNGDVWTCEIKKLDRGYLYVGVDYVDGTVSVDWRQVASIESPQEFVIQDMQGAVLVGPLKTSSGAEEDPTFTIQAGPSGVLRKSQVSSMQQTEHRFWDNLHGGLSGGLSYTKSNKQTQFSFTANADYRKEYWSAGADFQSTFAGSLSNKSNLRNNLSTQALRIINDRNYFAIALGNFLKSDEQQLDLRTTLGGGMGKILHQSEDSRILALGGIVWTRERYTTGEDNAPDFNSAEAVLGTRLEYFRFKTTNYNLSLFVYPSLTQPGRTRIDGNTGVRFEIIKDLTFNVNFYLNYDSRPPRSTTKSDYGASSSIGWTF